MAKQYLNYAGLELYDSKIKAYSKVVFKENKTGDIITSIDVYQGVDNDGNVPEGATPIGTISNLEGTHVKSGALRVVPANGDAPAKTYIDLYYAATASGTPDVSIDISSVTQDIDGLKAAIDKLNGNVNVAGSVANSIYNQAANAHYKDEQNGVTLTFPNESQLQLPQDIVDILKSGETFTNDTMEVILSYDSETEKYIATDKESGESAELESEDILKKVTIKDALNKLNDNTSVKITELTDSSEYLKSYKFEQAGSVIGTINIPKDFLVKGGSVVWFEENSDPEAGGYIMHPSLILVTELPAGVVVNDKYLALTINVADSSAETQVVYIPTKDLVDADALDGRIVALETAVGKDDDTDTLIPVATRIDDEAVNATYAKTSVPTTKVVRDGVAYTAPTSALEEAIASGQTTITMKNEDGDTIQVTLAEFNAGDHYTVVEKTSIKDKIDEIEDRLDSDFVAITSQQVLDLFDVINIDEQQY